MPFETSRVDPQRMASIRSTLAARGLPGGPLVIPENFSMTAPSQSQLDAQGQNPSAQQQTLLPNPQTDEFLAMLGLDHVVTVPCPGFQPSFGGVKSGAGAGTTAASEGGGAAAAAAAAAAEIDLDAATQDPNEIQLD